MVPGAGGCGVGVGVVLKDVALPLNGEWHCLRAGDINDSVRRNSCVGCVGVGECDNLRSGLYAVRGVRITSSGTEGGGGGGCNVGGRSGGERCRGRSLMSGLFGLGCGASGCDLCGVCRPGRHVVCELPCCPSEVTRRTVVGIMGSV